MRKTRIPAVPIGAFLLLLSSAPALQADFGGGDSQGNGDHGGGPTGENGQGEATIRHVLLLSIDGMHALDFANCAAGLSTAPGGPYCPNLAGLATHGVTYVDTSSSKPSDSFPGLMAIVTGGSPRTVGAFYDVAYD